MVKHLDSSLIDVDVHPNYVSIVIKSKVLRLRLPAEVKVSDSKCQRSKVTGSLMVIMPKVNPKENAVTIRGDIKARAAASGSSTTTASSARPVSQDRVNRPPAKSAAATTTTTAKPKKLSLQEQMMQEAMESANSSSVAGTSSSSGDTSSSLLDANLNSKSNSGVNVSNIVKQRPQASEPVPDLLELNTVFQKSARVTELD